MGLNKRLIGAGATAGAGGLTPSENFKAVTYTGNSGTQPITGVGFKPDLVWIKERDGGAENHNWIDSTRGTNKIITSNSSGAEFTSTRFTSFDTDGFTLANNNETNDNNVKYVAWCWKAGGGTTSSNTDGNITTTVQVNADAGFSIVTGTTPSSTANTDNAGHGLGVAPDLIIMKPLVVEDWYVYHSALGEGSLTRLNTTAGEQTGVDSIFSVVNSTTFRTNYTGTGNHPFVAYCFKAIDGFSKFGSYTGNGTTLIIETGFEPSFILIKGIVGNDNWRVYDTARGISAGGYLRADSDAAEDTGDAPNINILSNGFEITAGGTTVGNNANGNGYVYWAFAADPDTEAPTLASSFNIETWTGTGSARSITGLGFSPNLAWMKIRTQSYDHNLIDTIRGVNKQVRADRDIAEVTNADLITSFDSDGVSLGTGSDVNKSGDSFVGWFFKADDNKPTIFGGAALAMYKFEDNANDVSGEYNGTASNVSYVTGNFNKAAEFNGSSSGINIGNVGIGGSAERTISAWVNVDSLSSAQTIFQYGSNSNGQRFGFAIDTAGKIYVEFYNRDAITSASHISINTWYHLVVTYNGGAIQTTENTKIYVNGVAVDVTNSGAQTGNANTGDSNYGIGYDRLNTRQYFDGKIDQVRIYKGVVSDVGVASLYAETVSDNDNLVLGGPPEYIISANANAGFSILKYESIGMSGIQIPHGLSATPNMVLIKCTSDGSTNWIVYHSSLGNSKYLTLNSPSSEDTSGNWLVPRASTIQLNQTFGNANTSGRQYIAYCFHDVAGYQKFGTYTGNGSALGNVVALGFEPDFLMVKRTDSSSDWAIADTARDDNNYPFNTLEANSNSAEITSGDDRMFSEFMPVGDSNNPTGGFRFRNSDGPHNVSGGTYIYWAIKMNPTQYPISVGQMAFLVVAGGGSGNYSSGAGGVGGGGAGGLRTSYGLVSGGGSNVESNITLATGTYTITVGAGGASSSGSANNGGDSSISATGLTTISSTGGGGGGAGNGNGSAGGSGGGAGERNNAPDKTGGSGTANQGYAGGTATVNFNGGGGGGAAGVGGNNGGSLAGNGGLGIASAITGRNDKYAGGGGGSAYQTSSTGGLGSYGGGNGTLRGIRTVATAGEANTGGGGGALGGSISASGSTAGGSGVVVLRLLTSQYSGSTTGSPTVTTNGDETILKYTSSGTYVHS